MVKQRFLDPHINLSGAFRGAKAGYKIKAPWFLVLLNTNQSEPGRCFLKDTDGSQPPRAQQILAIPSVFLLWAPCTDLVRIPAKGSPRDYRKWLQSHRECSSSLSDKHHSPCATIHMSLQSISEAAANEEMNVFGCDSISGCGTEENMLPCTIPKAQGNLRAVPLTSESLENPLCPAASLALRCCLSYAQLWTGAWKAWLSPLTEHWTTWAEADADFRVKSFL